MSAPTLVGYLGSFGPIFTQDHTDGKKIVLVGNLSNGQLQAYSPAFVENLRKSTAGPQYVFPYAPDQCTLGPYSDTQIVGATPAYKEPPIGPKFDYYLNVASDWTDKPAPAYSGGTVTTSTGGGSGSGGSTSSGGGTVTTTTGGTTTTATDTTYQAPTITEQITTFLSNYWWLVLIIAIALLWKPVIGPALGLSKKRRRSYR